ncbi:hypothetical protein GVN16_09730 [Emticicia sp. CRIBPO]|uniref:hypothetical protein n=1 Tax=Emticicia sp. CRIBPO TaxID=2683258 RepID=UPI0014134BBE|nr:hypothetical protein [Emticicia sp. CRIBPO]NBA86041.1 hypothetical protein [Emticicia sp. CRIBPO]
MPGLLSHQKTILNLIFIEPKLSPEDPEIAGRVEEPDKNSGLTYILKKIRPGLMKAQAERFMRAKTQ